MKYSLWLILAVTCCQFLSAQSPGETETEDTSNIPQPDTTGKYKGGQPDSVYKVRNIVFLGNKRTRSDFMMRELPFKPGQSYSLSELVSRFELGRRQLMNTALFHEVVVALKGFEGYDADVMVQVKERWYIFPVPYFRPVDRNLNQWLVEQKASLKRVNYGAKLLYNNVTGRNDKLRVYIINGFTKQLSFSYDRYYIDRAMKFGLNMSVAMGKNKEHNYNTIANKQVFLKSEEFLRKFLVASAEVTYRRAIKTRHRLGVSFTSEEVHDTILKLNPTFFKSPGNSVAFPEIYYVMSFYDLDYIPYPTKGYAAEVVLAKRGFTSDMNVWHFNAKGSGNWHLGEKSFLSVVAGGTIKLPFRQPFYNQRLLGYGDAFLQGYEYYVIDGVAAAYVKPSLNRKLVKFNIKIPGGKKREPQKIPFTIYGKVYGNAGYVHNPQPGENFLANQMLYSGGFGIDIFTLYDVTFKLEWSFNQLGQNGIFIHRKSVF